MGFFTLSKPNSGMLRRRLSQMSLPCPGSDRSPAKTDRPPSPRLEQGARARTSSVSHRAHHFRCLALGETVVSACWRGEDVLCTAAALRAPLRADPCRKAQVWRVAGLWRRRRPGNCRRARPRQSGTVRPAAVRILASHPFTSFNDGDGRCGGGRCKRVIEAALPQGARFVSRDGGRMPLGIVGTDEKCADQSRCRSPPTVEELHPALAGLNTGGPRPQ